MNHEVVARRDASYPFKAFWACACGHVFLATYSGPGKAGLEAEFQRHKDEVDALEESTD